MKRFFKNVFETKTNHAKRTPHQRRQSTLRPQIEALEDRLVLSTLTTLGGTTLVQTTATLSRTEPDSRLTFEVNDVRVAYISASSNGQGPATDEDCSFYADAANYLEQQAQQPGVTAETAASLNALRVDAIDMAIGDGCDVTMVSQGATPPASRVTTSRLSAILADGNLPILELNDRTVAYIQMGSTGQGEHDDDDCQFEANYVNGLIDFTKKLATGQISGENATQDPNDYLDLIAEVIDNAEDKGCYVVYMATPDTTPLTSLATSRVTTSTLSAILADGLLPILERNDRVVAYISMGSTGQGPNSDGDCDTYADLANDIESQMHGLELVNQFGETLPGTFANDEDADQFENLEQLRDDTIDEGMDGGCFVVYMVTLDKTAPTSSVTVLSEVIHHNQFTVNWSGSDDLHGSGVSRHDVFVSVDGGPFTAWQSGVTTTSAVFRGEFGKSYSFHSVAADKAGNRESAPASADARTTLAAPWLTNNAGTFTDVDGDVYTVKLTGPGRAAVVRDDPDGDGHGPMSLIYVEATDALRSNLTITVRQAAGGDGIVTIGALTGSGLKSISAKSSDLVGDGISLSGLIGSLTLNNVAGGTIAAPAIGKLTIGKDFDADLLLSGNPDPKKATLGSANIGGNIADAVWEIHGNIDSLAVKGATSNWELSADALRTGRFGKMDDVILNIAEALTSFSSQTFVNSTLTAETISAFMATGIRGSPVPAFANSNLTAAAIGNVSLASVATDNGGKKYGIKADSIGSVTVQTPSFRFDNANSTPQGIGDFEVGMPGS